MHRANESVSKTETIIEGQRRVCVRTETRVKTVEEEKKHSLYVPGETTRRSLKPTP